jgi:uncharacterized oxidoreductase
VNALCARITASAPAEGVETVMLPGDRAAAYRREREAAGIPIPDATWAAIKTLAAELMVPVAEVRRA